MFSKFFIERPIFATVLSLFFMLGGGISLMALPISQYPDLLPPSVMVFADYNGASSEVISQSVAAPLEQSINGVDDMIYMNSMSSSSGSLIINVYFQIGTNPDQALINVNNRVQAVMSTLPDEVRRMGVRVVKRSSTILQVLALTSPSGDMAPTEINNYALINVLDDLKRVPGVGDAIILGSRDYSMRIWLKPDRMARLGITVDDITNAVRAQNNQFAAGKIGQPPIEESMGKVFSLIVRGRLNNPEEFGEIILRANPDGSTLRLKEVANIELGAKGYDFMGKDDRHPAVPILINLSSGANALATADGVQETMERISQTFPSDLRYRISYDTTTFVRISIKEVVKTLIEAMCLVFLVVFVFLKSFRATLIPCLAVPVSIIGTFAGMQILGFSINTLTLFGLVLSIGIVVDDAIVVIENTERIMRTHKLPAKEATIRAMQEVTSPIVAIVLVLCAVFIPVAFMQGLSGTMYKQFAMTISTSVIISGFVALTLTPALCALMLKPHQENRKKTLLDRFESAFQKVTFVYLRMVRYFLNNVLAAVLVITVMIGVTGFLFWKTPGSLVPLEDQGTVMGFVSLDNAASLDRTEKVMDQLSEIALNDPRVEHITTLIGYDMQGQVLRNSSGACFIGLAPWNERPGRENSSQSIAFQLMGKSADIVDARVYLTIPPPIIGLSIGGGFEGFLQNRGTGDFLDLNRQALNVVAAASQRPELANVRTTFAADTPQYLVEVDDAKAYALGVDTATLYRTMQATYGDFYVNDFNKLGRTFQVKIQSEPSFRMTPDSLKEVFVGSIHGEMIPLSSLITLKPILGPDSVERFNVFPAAKLIGEPAPGYTSGQAINAMEQVVNQVVDSDFSLAWIGSAFQEKQITRSSAIAFVLGLLVVFLILSAQYERWTLPIAVIMTVPFALFGAIVFVALRGMANDIYFQIALVTLVGLSAKNAILIVEFAHHIHMNTGMTLKQSAVEAAGLRFRPIIMTSLAFIFGCMPLVISTGAGAASRHSIGTGVVGGMVAATVLAPLFVPLFYAAVMKGPQVLYKKFLRNIAFFSKKKNKDQGKTI